MKKALTIFAVIAVALSFGAVNFASAKPCPLEIKGKRPCDMTKEEKALKNKIEMKKEAVKKAEEEEAKKEQ